VTGVGKTLRAGSGIGVTGVGQQVTHRAVHAFAGDEHGGSAEGVGGGHAGDTGALGTAHDHYVLTPWSLDAGRSDAEFETGYRVQSR
jgi:hypothetical protein